MQLVTLVDADLVELYGRGSVFTVVNDIVFNQCMVRCNTPEETARTLVHIQSCGVTWCGGATWENQFVIRISVCSWATTTNDVTTVVEVFSDAYQQVVAEMAEEAREIGVEC